MDAPEVKPADALPPKVLSVQARRLDVDEGTEAALIAAARLAGRLDRRHAGEFPVLEAFQQFLESERRRSRRNMLLMTGIFVGALLAVIAASTLLGTAIYREMADDLDGFRDDLGALQKQSEALQASAQQTVERVAGDADALRQQVAGVTAAQTKESERYGTALESLRRQLAAVEARNETVARDIDSVRAVIPSLSADMGVVVNLLATMSNNATPASTELPDEPLLESAPVAEPVVAESTEPPALTPSAAWRAVTVQVKPLGGKTDLPWRLLIPE